MKRHAKREIIYNLTMYKLPFTQAYVWTEKNACINARRYMYVPVLLHVCNGKSTCTYAMKWGIFYNETKSKQLLKVHKSVGIGRRIRILNYDLWFLNCLRNVENSEFWISFAELRLHSLRNNKWHLHFARLHEPYELWIKPTKRETFSIPRISRMSMNYELPEHWLQPLRASTFGSTLNAQR